MEVKSCRVTISDREGVIHSVNVTAATLYEAVALGLRQIRGHEWVEEIATGLNTVKVQVKSVQIEHEVKIVEFMKWVERKGGSPSDIMKKRKIRQILELPESS